MKQVTLAAIEKAIEVIDNLTDEQLENITESYADAQEALLGYVMTAPEEYKNEDLEGLLIYYFCLVLEAFKQEGIELRTIVEEDIDALEEPFFDMLDQYFESEDEEIIESFCDQPFLAQFMAMEVSEEDEDGLEVAFESGQFGNEFLELRAVRVFGKGYNRHLFREEPIHFEFRLKKKKPDFCLSCLIKVKDEFEQPVFFSLSLSNQTKLDLGKDTENYSGELTYQVSLPSRFLASGTYFLTLFFGKESERGHVYSERAFLFPRTIVFRVQVSEEEFVSYPEHFSVNPAFEWHLKKN